MLLTKKKMIVIGEMFIMPLAKYSELICTQFKNWQMVGDKEMQWWELKLLQNDVLSNAAVRIAILNGKGRIMLDTENIIEERLLYDVITNCLN